MGSSDGLAAAAWCMIAGRFKDERTSLKRTLSTAFHRPRSGKGWMHLILEKAMPILSASTKLCNMASLEHAWLERD